GGGRVCAGDSPKLGGQVSQAGAARAILRLLSPAARPRRRTWIDFVSTAVGGALEKPLDNLGQTQMRVRLHAWPWRIATRSLGGRDPSVKLWEVRKCQDRAT